MKKYLPWLLVIVLVLVTLGAYLAPLAKFRTQYYLVSLSDNTLYVADLNGVTGRCSVARDSYILRNVYTVTLLNPKDPESLALYRRPIDPYDSAWIVYVPVSQVKTIEPINQDSKLGKLVQKALGLMPTKP